MEAIELALKSSHLIKASGMSSQQSSATLSNVAMSPSNNNDNTANNTTIDLLNDSFKSNRSDTFNSIKSSSSSSSTNLTKMMTHELQVNQQQQQQQQQLQTDPHRQQTKQKKHSGGSNEEQLMLTESEDNKNSSGDGEDGCSMNSSITNNMNANENNLDEYDEDFFYDEMPTATEKAGENTAAADLPVETTYCPSVKEEFGEVSLFRVGKC